jgi:GTPase
MAFVDEIKIRAKAGDGGPGVVRWRQEKFIPKGGPAGGDGGKGGDVFIRAVRGMHILAKYRHKKEFKAENGFAGETKSKHGRDGEDLIIDLPVGSIVKNIETGDIFRLDKDNQIEKILKGGRGGFGNEHYKSSLNTTPRKASDGKPGMEGTFHIELELVADVGLVGLPNAGKSSLLNALTNSKAKIGDFPFTTLDPNLGDFYGYVIADIPGVIEGASEGKGLGLKFLKHIKRTKMLVHLVSFESGANMKKAYETIRKELETYGDGLDEKEEIILLTKTDIIPNQKEIDKKIKEFKKYSDKVYIITLFDDKSVKKFADDLVKEIQK